MFVLNQDILETIPLQMESKESIWDNKSLQTLLSQDLHRKTHDVRLLIIILKTAIKRMDISKVIRTPEDQKLPTMDTIQTGTTMEPNSIDLPFVEIRPEQLQNQEATREDAAVSVAVVEVLLVTNHLRDISRMEGECLPTSMKSFQSKSYFILTKKIIFYSRRNKRAEYKQSNVSIPSTASNGTVVRMSSSYNNNIGYGGYPQRTVHHVHEIRRSTTAERIAPIAQAECSDTDFESARSPAGASRQNGVDSNVKRGEFSLYRVHAFFIYLKPVLRINKCFRKSSEC